MREASHLFYIIDAASCECLDSVLNKSDEISE